MAVKVKRKTKADRLIKNRPFGISWYLSAIRERPIGEVFLKKSSGFGDHYFSVHVQGDNGEDEVAHCAEEWMAEAIVEKFKRKR